MLPKFTLSAALTVLWLFTSPGHLVAVGHADDSNALSAQGSGAPQGPAAGSTAKPPSAPPDMRPPFPWWNDATFRRELALTDERAKRIDDIYQSRLRQMKPYYDEWVRAFADLERMTAERTADETSYELKVSYVESLRSKVRESRTVMLYKIYRQLDPAQYQKLREIIERRTGPGSGSGRGDGRR